MAKRSFWAWGLEPDEPTAGQMRTAAAELSKRYSLDLTPVAPPKPSDLSLREPRVSQGHRPPPRDVSTFIHGDPRIAKATRPLATFSRRGRWLG